MRVKRGNGKKRGKELTRRLEDVPDLGYLKVIKRGKHVEDCVCTAVYVSVWGVCMYIQVYDSCPSAGCSPSVYLSLFSDQVVIENDASDSIPASFMYSIYPCVTSGGLHLFTESVAADQMILRNYW